MTTKKAATKSKKSTALVKIDQELAQYADQFADQEANTGGGQFFSLKNGNLSFNDSPLPNDEMICVIMDSVLENTFYEGEYDPDDRQPPLCYAFGRDEDTMAPYKDVDNPECSACAECEQNQWGTAAKGRGKACKNRRRLAIISAGKISRGGDYEIIDDPEHYEKGEIGYLGIPATSINSFGMYVKQVKGAMKLPPFAVITRVFITPDNKSQFKVNFELIEAAPKTCLEALLNRHKLVRDQIEFGYPKPEETPLKKRKGGKRITKKTAKKAGRRVTKKSKGRQRKY